MIAEAALRDGHRRQACGIGWQFLRTGDDGVLLQDVGDDLCVDTRGRATPARSVGMVLLVTV